jgi:hypothetical protein
MLHNRRSNYATQYSSGTRFVAEFMLLSAYS